MNKITVMIVRIKKYGKTGWICEGSIKPYIYGNSVDLC